MGLSPETELADIRAYLEKNIRLRGNLNAYLRGTISVDAYRTSLSLDTNAINDAHLNHPLSGNGLWTLVRGKTAAESKQAWIDATRSVEYTKLFAHASAVSLGFQGPTVGDDAGIGINDLPTVFSSAIRSRMFMLYDCSTSDYRVDGNLGMRAVLAGDALVSLGAPYVADVHLYRDILDARGFELGLGVGRNLAFMAPYLRLEHWMHFNGDPTIVMRKVDLAQPRPQLVVNGTPIVRESVVPVTLDQPFSGEVGVCKSVTFSNVGNADLVLYISYVPSFSTTALADAGSGGRWSTWKDGNAFIQSVGGYNVPKQLVVLPGQSQAITYVLRAVNDGSVKLTGAQRGYFTVTCNDPRVGVIRIDAQGKIPE